MDIQITTKSQNSVCLVQAKRRKKRKKETRRDKITKIKIIQMDNKNIISYISI